MRSELLAGSEEATEPTAAAAARPAGAAFEPYFTGGRPPDDPGARHAAWTLAAMLRSPLRDLLARAERPLRAVMLGAREGWLALQLLDWGLERVSVCDPDAERRRRLSALAEAAASPAGGLELAADAADAEQDRFDLAFADLRAGSSEAEGLVATAARLAPWVAALTAERRAARAALAGAGLERIELVQPPADGERRFIKLESALLVGSRAARQ